MINAAIAELRKRNRPVPKPTRLPTATEVDNTEKSLGVRFHPDYRQLLLHGSDVVCGTIEPCTVLGDGNYTDLVEVASTAWKQMGLPRRLLPICEANGDYYCMNPDGAVEFWSHNGLTNEKWETLADWIMKVWIKGR